MIMCSINTPLTDVTFYRMHCFMEQIMILPYLSKIRIKSSILRAKFFAPFTKTALL